MEYMKKVVTYDDFLLPNVLVKLKFDYPIEGELVA